MGSEEKAPEKYHEAGIYIVLEVIFGLIIYIANYTLSMRKIKNNSPVDLNIWCGSVIEKSLTGK